MTPRCPQTSLLAMRPAVLRSGSGCVRQPASGSLARVLSVVYEIADLDQIDGLNTGRLSGFSYARDDHPNAVQLAGKMCESAHRSGPGVCLGDGCHRLDPPDAGQPGALT